LPKFLGPWPCFDLRDFAIGTVYAKTEVILVAIVSAIALGEPLRPLGWIAAVVCMIGVAWLAAPTRLRNILTSPLDPAALMGILAGFGFAVAAVGIRGAATTLDEAPVWSRALLTLTVMLGIQTVLNASQLFVNDRTEITNVGRAWRTALPVGVLSLLGSISWAVAVTLTSATKVRTLGQVELVMAFAISVWWLHEPLVLIGVVGVVVVG